MPTNTFQLLLLFYCILLCFHCVTFYNVSFSSYCSKCALVQKEGSRLLVRESLKVKWESVSSVFHINTYIQFIYHDILVKMSKLLHPYSLLEVNFCALKSAIYHRVAIKIILYCWKPHPYEFEAILECVEWIIRLDTKQVVIPSISKE